MMFTVVGGSSFSILWYTWSYIYMFSYHTLPPSHWFPAEVWTLPPPASIDIKGCYLQGSAAPGLRDIYHSWCSQSFHAHKGEAIVTWTLGYRYSNLRLCQDKPTHVLTPCTVNSVQRLWPFTSNGKFMFSQLQQQTFWLSSLAFPSPFST